MAMKPIETRYKGYRFRSRLEARWAVFFDVMGIRWEYEPEGFELDDGSRYLPDFLLHGIKLQHPETSEYATIDLYVEVKHAGTQEEDWIKAKKFSLHKPILLLAGTPKPLRGDTLCVPVPIFDEKYWYAYNDNAIEDWFQFVSFFRKNEICFKDEIATKQEHEWIVSVASDAARSARFEFGECGVPA